MRGDAVIVAHAASHVLAGRPDVLRILVTASPQVRAKRLAGMPGVDDGEAAVREAEKARADYLQRFLVWSTATPHANCAPRPQHVPPTE